MFNFSKIMLMFSNFPEIQISYSKYNSFKNSKSYSTIQKNLFFILFSFLLDFNFGNNFIEQTESINIAF